MTEHFVIALTQLAHRRDVFLEKGRCFLVSPVFFFLSEEQIEALTKHVVLIFPSK